MHIRITSFLSYYNYIYLSDILKYDYIFVYGIWDSIS